MYGATERLEAPAPAPPIVISMDWKAEGVAKVAGVVAVPLVLCVLIYMAKGSWWLIALIVGIEATLYAFGTYPEVLRTLVQIRQDNHDAAVRLAAIAAKKEIDALAIEARRQVDLAAGEHYHELRDGHDRQVALTAGAVAEALPVIDPFDDFVWECVVQAYRKADRTPGPKYGLVPDSIISRRRTAARFSEGRHPDVMDRIITSGVAEYRKQRWYVKLDAYPTLETAWEALTGRRWRG